MDDDLRQMLNTLTANSEKQSKLLEEQNKMLQQHAKVLEDYGARFDSFEKRLNYLEQNMNVNGQNLQNPFNQNPYKIDVWTVDDLSMRTWQISGFHYGNDFVVKFMRDGYAPGGVLMFSEPSNKMYRWSFNEKLTIYDGKGKQIDSFNPKQRHRDGKGKIVWNGTSGKLVELY